MLQSNRWQALLLVALASMSGCSVSNIDSDPSERAAYGIKPMDLKAEYPIFSFAFSSDGALFATSDGPQLWDAKTGTPIPGSRPTKHKSWHSTRMAFSPDGNYLAAIYLPGMINEPLAILDVWSISETKGLRWLWSKTCADRLSSQSHAYHLAFSPDSRSIAVGSPDETVHIWDLASGKEQLKFNGGVAVTYSDNGSQLIAVRHDGAIRRFDATTGKPVGKNLRGRDPEFLHVGHAAIAEEVQRVAISDGHVVLVKDLETGANLTRIETPARSWTIDLSPDGKTLAVSLSEGIAFFDANTGRELGWLYGKSGRIDEFGFSCDGLAFVWAENEYGDEKATSFISIRDPNSLSLASRRVKDKGTAPIKVELLTGNGVVALDLNGISPEQFSDLALKNQAPSYPKIDWKLRVTNTGAGTIILQDPARIRHACYLIGPAAINRFVGGQIVGFPPNNDHNVTLAPGAFHDLPFTYFPGMFTEHYWVAPGEYSVHVSTGISISPDPKRIGAARTDFGSVAIDVAPVRVKVVSK